MSRARLTQTPVDLVTDSGAIILSIVKGEQLEFPVILNFLSDATLKVGANYTYEAVLIEALNVSGQTAPPTEIKPGGVQTVLPVRQAVYIGVWDSVAAYNKEEVVKYGDKYYKLLGGVSRINATVPSVDPLWAETSLNTVYIQCLSTLISTWVVQPIAGKPVYGFIELRVTEPNDIVFTRTWKPVRGMVEILFSPTDVVVDL